MTYINDSALSIEKELNWFFEILDTRMRLHFGQESERKDIEEIAPPDLRSDNSRFANFIKDNKLNERERIMLALTFMVHYKP